jgi:hypothetical protein
MGSMRTVDRLVGYARAFNSQRRKGQDDIPRLAGNPAAFLFNNDVLYSKIAQK